MEKKDKTNSALVKVLTEHPKLAEMLGSPEYLYSLIKSEKVKEEEELRILYALGNKVYGQERMHKTAKAISEGLYDEIFISYPDKVREDLKASLALYFSGAQGLSRDVALKSFTRYVQKIAFQPSIEASIQPFIDTGRKIKESTRQGHEEVHGTREEKQERWRAYNDACIALKQEKPIYTLTEIRKRVATDFGVSLRTITRHTPELKKHIFFKK